MMGLKFIYKKDYNMKNHYLNITDFPGEAYEAAPRTLPAFRQYPAPGPEGRAGDGPAGPGPGPAGGAGRAGGGRGIALRNSAVPRESLRDIPRQTPTGH